MAMGPPARCCSLIRRGWGGGGGTSSFRGPPGVPHQELHGALGPAVGNPLRGAQARGVEARGRLEFGPGALLSLQLKDGSGWEQYGGYNNTTTTATATADELWTAGAAGDVAGDVAGDAATSTAGDQLSLRGDRTYRQINAASHRWLAD